MRHFTATFVLSLILAAPAHSEPVQFDFRSSFLLNLHSFLYNAAQSPDSLRQVTWETPPSTEEMQQLQAAVDYYRANYAKRHPVFDEELGYITDTLASDDQRRDAEGLALPQSLAQALHDAAPAYARTAWPAHDRMNRDWIAKVRELNLSYGAEIQERASTWLGHAYPAGIRVDVVPLTGTRQGAYTLDEPPHSIIPSAIPSYQGLAALEMLYHEAAHAGAIQPLEQALDKAAQAQGRDAGDLWHVLQFSAVGAATQQTLAAHGIAYTPYADSKGLYAAAWPQYLAPMKAAWLPYLAGKMQRDKAIAQLVKRLPPRAPAPPAHD
ncbi:hypothetical protein [Pseudoduganella violaceinigra]|uniref:hypothetical protein n=1 Tax=Pseudoduganella violaceinigra TaxID=246602 RepID=UPI00042357FD|nr:hypothetical protein [Pseudoduganella violaceinigra]